MCAAALLAIALVPGAAACRGRAETPPELAQAYRALVASLDESVPGASFARLRDFSRQNERYAVSAEAASALEAWRGRMDAAYRRSRDLAREGRYPEAEAILNDLASVTDEPAGRQARAFLAYEFHKLKASRLLDATALVDADVRMTRTTAFQSSARGVGAIESYTATPDGFSFVLVGGNPTERLRVTQSGIEADPAR